MDSTIWEGIQQEQMEGGLLLTSCGAELQELMRQIDNMVRQKKMDWERKLSTTQDKLEVREQELHHTKSLLNQKHQEIGMLKHRLDAKEGDQKNVTKQYENQLTYMRKELQQLKSSHTKMIKYYTKQGKVSEREQSLQNEIERLQNDLASKVNSETEFEKEKSSWEIQQLALKQQIECLEVQRKSLAEKAERSQQQAYSYQSRLKRSNQLVEEVESTSQNLVKKLESELLNDKELIQTQETLIKELQNKTREIEDSRKKSVREKYQLQEELDKMTCRARVFEDEGRELTATLNTRESAIRDSELEIAELKNRIADVENMLHTKQKLIESLQTRSPLKSREAELQRSVSRLESVIANHQTTESRLRDENRNMCKEVENYQQQIKELSDAVKRMEMTKVNNLNTEIRRLRDKVEEMQRSHSATLCSMKAEVTNLSSHLHNRDTNIVQLAHTCTEMEKQLKEECCRRSQLATELQTTASQLRNLQEQQGVVSRLVREKKATDQSLVEAEHDLSSLKHNYDEAVGKLEQENKTLLKKVANLKNKMQNQEVYNAPDLTAVLQHTRNVIDDLRETDRVRMLEEYSAPISSHGSDPKVGVAHSQKSGDTAVIKDLLNSEGSQRSQTSTPTREFLRSIGIGASTSASEHSSETSELDDRELNAILGLDLPGEDGSNHFDEDSTDSGVQDFLKEEEVRSKRLESRINQHIENMKQAMAATVDKYLTPVH